MKKYIFLASIIFATNCGGTTSDSNDSLSSNVTSPTSVGGGYTCISGCTGICEFDSTLVVIQDDSFIKIVSESYPDAEGVIFDDDTFAVESDLCSCTGSFRNGKVISSCECEGESCQQSVFNLTN